MRFNVAQGIKPGYRCISYSYTACYCLARTHNSLPLQQILDQLQGHSTTQSFPTSLTMNFWNIHIYIYIYIYIYTHTHTLMCICCTLMCIAVFTLDAGLLARSQYSEGPATGHLDTGFSWFPCACKQMLRRFPRYQVATTCFSCSTPDLNLVVTNFMFSIHVK